MPVSVNKPHPDCWYFGGLYTGFHRRIKSVEILNYVEMEGTLVASSYQTRSKQWLCCKHYTTFAIVYVHTLKK